MLSPNKLVNLPHKIGQKSNCILSQLRHIPLSNKTITKVHLGLTSVSLKGRSLFRRLKKPAPLMLNQFCTRKSQM